MRVADFRDPPSDPAISERTAFAVWNTEYGVRRASYFKPRAKFVACGRVPWCSTTCFVQGMTHLVPGTKYFGPGAPAQVWDSTSEFLRFLWRNQRRQRAVYVSVGPESTVSRCFGNLRRAAIRASGVK